MNQSQSYSCLTNAGSGTVRQSESPSKSDRIQWLSVLQGFSMLLVVLGHITLTNTFQDPATPAVAAMERIIYSFHMPLFIFISGWLFCLTCINRDLQYGKMLKKKFKRLGIPFLFFTIATMVIKLLLSPFVKRPVDFEEIINTFVFFSSNPLGEMWFIIVLLILMSLYPVYRWLSRHDALIWGFGAALVLFIALPEDIQYFQLSKVVRFSIYFLCGIICCRYKIIETYSSKWYTLLGALALFICVNCLELASPLLNHKMVYAIGALSGIALSVAVCSFITTLRPTAFSSFSAYTFQIFLLGIFFQMAVRVIYGKVGHYNPVIYPVMFALSIIVGVYIPVLISKFIACRWQGGKKLLGL